MATSTCAKCGSRMEPGFVPEIARSPNALSTWVSGAAEKSWGSFKTRGRRKLVIETSRCTRCGYLESYAPE